MSVQVGTGISPLGNSYAFTLTRRESGGTFEVKLKDLRYTDPGVIFFTSAPMAIGGRVWKLTLSFDRAFTFLRRWDHWGWRYNLKDFLLSTSELCSYPCRKLCVMRKASGALFKDHFEIDNNCIVAVSSKCFSDPLTDNGRAPASRFWFKRIFLLVFGSPYSPLAWILLEVASCVIGVFLFFLLVWELFKLIVIAGLFLPMYLLAFVYFCFTYSIYLLCYYITLPFWHEIDLMTSTLFLLINGQTCLEHRITVCHKTCPIRNKTQSQKKIVQENEICEIKGFTDATSCLKPEGGYCSDGWLTILADIDIKRPENDVQGNRDGAQIMEAGQRVNPGARVQWNIDLTSQSRGSGPVDPCGSGEHTYEHPIQMEEHSECVICLVNQQTSGFAHKNTVHICVCEECAKVYDNLRKHSSVRCPYCNQKVEYIVYKVI